MNGKYSSMSGSGRVCDGARNVSHAYCNKWRLKLICLIPFPYRSELGSLKKFISHLKCIHCTAAGRLFSKAVTKNQEKKKQLSLGPISLVAHEIGGEENVTNCSLTLQNDNQPGTEKLP